MAKGTSLRGDESGQLFLLAGLVLALSIVTLSVVVSQSAQSPARILDAQRSVAFDDYSDFRSSAVTSIRFYLNSPGLSEDAFQDNVHRLWRERRLGYSDRDVNMFIRFNGTKETELCNDDYQSAGLKGIAATQEDRYGQFSCEAHPNNNGVILDPDGIVVAAALDVGVIGDRYDIQETIVVREVRDLFFFRDATNVTIGGTVEDPSRATDFPDDTFHVVQSARTNLPTRRGLMSVPDPIYTGDEALGSRQVDWSVTFGNPTDDSVDVSRIEVREEDGKLPFKSATSGTPSGWTVEQTQQPIQDPGFEGTTEWTEAKTPSSTYSTFEPSSSDSDCDDSGDLSSGRCVKLETEIDQEGAEQLVDNGDFGTTGTWTQEDDQAANTKLELSSDKLHCRDAVRTTVESERPCLWMTTTSTNGDGTQEAYVNVTQDFTTLSSFEAADLRWSWNLSEAEETLGSVTNSAQLWILPASGGSPVYSSEKTTNLGVWEDETADLADELAADTTYTIAINVTQDVPEPSLTTNNATAGIDNVTLWMGPEEETAVAELTQDFTSPDTSANPRVHVSFNLSETDDLNSEVDNWLNVTITEQSSGDEVFRWDYPGTLDSEDTGGWAENISTASKLEANTDYTIHVRIEHHVPYPDSDGLRRAISYVDNVKVNYPGLLVWDGSSDETVPAHDAVDFHTQVTMALNATDPLLDDALTFESRVVDAQGRTYTFSRDAYDVSIGTAVPSAFVGLDATTGSGVDFAGTQTLTSGQETRIEFTVDEQSDTTGISSHDLEITMPPGWDLEFGATDDCVDDPNGWHNECYLPTPTKTDVPLGTRYAFTSNTTWSASETHRLAVDVTPPGVDSAKLYKVPVELTPDSGSRPGAAADPVFRVEPESSSTHTLDLLYLSEVVDEKVGKSDMRASEIRLDMAANRDVKVELQIWKKTTQGGPASEWGWTTLKTGTVGFGGVRWEVRVSGEEIIGGSRANTIGILDSEGRDELESAGFSPDDGSAKVSQIPIRILSDEDRGFRLSVDLATFRVEYI